MNCHSEYKHLKTPLKHFKYDYISQTHTNSVIIDAQ